MVKIPEIIINEKSGFFEKKDFRWINITNFTVIGGINGSGKTKLLDYIWNDEILNQKYLIRYVDVNYNVPIEKDGNVIEGGYNYSLLVENGKYYALDKAGIKHDWNSNKNNFKNNVVTAKLDYAILDQIIKERKEFSKDIKNKEDEINKIKKYNSTGLIIDLLPDNINDDKSWDRIDRVLSDFGLLIRIDRDNLNAGLEFIRKDSALSLQMKDLSFGEKIAFALALWTWGNSKGQKTEILLIDEFDAHLNPLIAKQFISVIKKYFVDMDVQVIMTTHNPSTIVYAKKSEANVLWMSNGIIDSNINYEDIIRQLSDGLIDIYDLEYDLQLLIKNSKKCVLYTEGKIDEKHINNAIKALEMDADFKNIFVFGCTGVQSMPMFMRMPTNQAMQIALFDTDKEGREVFNKIKQDEKLNKRIDDKKLKRLFISCRKGKVIEDLFESNVKRNRGKTELANIMSREKNLTKNNFKSFKPLLDKICKVANL